MTRNPIIALLIAAAPMALLPGCATTTLQPAADASRAPGGGAVASTAGVEIVTMTPDFPGIVDIEGAVTPVKVRITNEGPNPVLIRYGDFMLTGADGTTYDALPLRRIDTTVSAPVGLYDPILSPRFRYRGFRVAPYYSGIYPGIPRFGDPFVFGRYGWGGYDAAFGGNFARVRLPTPEMYRNVLPEGVLDPGGSLEGWLYFQHVGRREGALSFNASVMSVSGASLGNIAIPYTFVR